VREDEESGLVFSRFLRYALWQLPGFNCLCGNPPPGFRWANLPRWLVWIGVILWVVKDLFFFLECGGRMTAILESGPFHGWEEGIVETPLSSKRTRPGPTERYGVQRPAEGVSPLVQARPFGSKRSGG